MSTVRISAVLVLIGTIGLASDNCSAAKEKERPRRVLFLTKSSGFEHSAVHREGDRLSYSEQVVTELGARYGFDVVCTKDANLVNAENLKNYDTVMFYTTGDLTKQGDKDKGVPMTEKNRQELLDWIRAGGGFFGSHTVTDTFHDWTPFIEMTGGEFASHGEQQYATLKVVDPKFPAVVGMPIEFKFIDEYYVNKNVNLGKSMRVLIMLETEGMKGDMYKIPAYPITWCSNYGKGRVFISALGHREDVWDMPMFQGMVVKALKWTFGDVPGDASPNFQDLIK